MKIGIDLGGHTILAAGISEPDGNLPPAIVGMSEIKTPRSRSVADVVNAIAELARTIAAGDSVTSLGVAVPAMIDVERRRTLKPPNFPLEWENLDFTAKLADALAVRGFHIDVKMENDANCYALGEGLVGEAVGLSDFVVITMGTGIGCGIVSGGRLLTGAHGMAGESGHAVVNGIAPCGCGGIGHAETMAAADGTSKRAQEAGLPVDFRELWALRGTPKADAVLNVTVDGMARTVATVYHVLDPQLVILGGGMSRAAGMAEAIREAALPYLSKPFKSVIDVRVSQLGNNAALYGAAAI